MDWILFAFRTLVNQRLDSVVGLAIIDVVDREKNVKQDCHRLEDKVGKEAREKNNGEKCEHAFHQCGKESHFDPFQTKLGVVCIQGRFDVRDVILSDLKEKIREISALNDVDQAIDESDGRGQVLWNVGQ